jgi:hypothetical protein
MSENLKANVNIPTVTQLDRARLIAEKPSRAKVRIATLEKKES